MTPQAQLPPPAPACPHCGGTHAPRRDWAVWVALALLFLLGVTNRLAISNHEGQLLQLTNRVEAVAARAWQTLGGK